MLFLVAPRQKRGMAVDGEQANPQDTRLSF